ncbi:hypothetical protein BKA70DRAFT_1109927 [Coprinopsis sp. MPI-PUGE-AT-0042]|nr:hypothetical protein BKA70DRAFT_1109927 [Coprinopsis sp. MPI-PUGE-AT-0042]
MTVSAVFLPCRVRHDPQSLGFEEVTVQSCECDPVGCILVRHGLFPTSPIQPRMAVSISLLDLYQALFERSCDAVTAFTDAMHTYYKRRGFVYCNLQGNEVDDAWRRSVAQAIQWYDNLRAKVNNAVAEVLQTADKLIRELDGEQGQECSSSLQEKCPACFGGRTFGAPTEAGADIHVSLDGNFSHRHLRRPVDEGKQYHVPPYYVSKEYVDKVGEAMSAAKTRPAKARKPKVPDEAVDGCEDGHIAGKGTNVKTSTQIYDDTGTMALCCRHDIPIFVANIDTPGEQQKYAVALLKVLYSHLPANATVIAFYDVGCVLDRSLQTYDYLPEDITSRLSFVTSGAPCWWDEWQHDAPGTPPRGSGCWISWSFFRRPGRVFRGRSFGLLGLWCLNEGLLCLVAVFFYSWTLVALATIFSFPPLPFSGIHDPLTIAHIPCSKLMLLTLIV